MIIELAATFVMGAILGFFMRGPSNDALLSLQQENEDLRKERDWMERTIVTLSRLHKDEDRKEE